MSGVAGFSGSDLCLAAILAVLALVLWNLLSLRREVATLLLQFRPEAAAVEVLDTKIPLSVPVPEVSKDGLADLWEGKKAEQTEEGALPLNQYQLEKTDFQAATEDEIDLGLPSLAEKTDQREPEVTPFKLEFGGFGEFMTECGATLSMKGITVRTQDVRPEGAEMDLDIHLKDGVSLLEGRVQVVRVEEGNPGLMELRFLRLDPNGMRLIQKISRG